MVLFSLWFLYFIIYSVLGWVVETVYCSVLERRFVERGFLRGPLCPIYGTGALILLIVLKPIENWVLIFVISFLLTSVLEYITSYAMEKIFKMRWWDYSERFLNLNGRVCLLNSTLFGLLALALTKILHPFVEARTALLPHNILFILAIFFGVLFLVDFIISVHASFRLKSNLEKLREAQEHLKEELTKYQQEIREHLIEGKEDLLEQLAEGKENLKESLENRKEALVGEGKEHLRELRLRLTASERYILRSFPDIRPIKRSLALQLEGLREEVRKAKNHRKMS
ncbi:MAG TPA: hypothetical protein PKD52_00870 [Clostridiales bacterium]|nr:hypothetical protein [Clostridiales bacterium]